MQVAYLAPMTLLALNYKTGSKRYLGITYCISCIATHSAAYGHKVWKNWLPCGLVRYYTGNPHTSTNQGSHSDTNFKPRYFGC